MFTFSNEINRCLPAPNKAGVCIWSWRLHCTKYHKSTPASWKQCMTTAFLNNCLILYSQQKKSPFFIGMLVDHHHELLRSTLSKAEVVFSYLLALRQPAVATETGKETTSPRASLQGGLTVFQPRPYLWKQLLHQLYWREKILLIPAMDCPLSTSVPITILASVCCLQVNNKRISDTYEGILHIGICVTFLLQR